jgi:hypothetical protein
MEVRQYPDHELVDTFGTADVFVIKKTAGRK